MTKLKKYYIMIPAIIQNSDRNHGGTYMKKLNVGILGFGTVGGGAYEILTKNHDLITQEPAFPLMSSRLWSAESATGSPRI